MMNFSVLITDDHPIFRSGLANLLKSRVKEVLEAENGKEALEILKRKKIDIVFLDIEMPIMDGIQTMEELKKRHPGVKVITLTMFANDYYIEKMCQLGIDGFLLKNTSSKELTRCLSLVTDGEKYYTPEVAARIFEGLKSEKPILNLDNAGLTEREIDVLKLACEQQTNKEIADKLFISENTVKTHKTHLFHKTQSDTLAGLVIFAIKNNLFRIRAA